MFMGGKKIMKNIQNYCTLILIVFILLGITSSAYSDDQLFSKIKSPQKSVIASGDYVLVKGRWKKAGGTDKLNINKPPTINTVDVICDKGDMICWECIAQLVTTKDMGMLAKTKMSPQLTVDTTIFKIIDWSDNTIIAKASFRASDYILRISIKDSYAERRRQETKARGNEHSDPDIFERWVLE